MWRVFNQKEKGAIVGGFLFAALIGVLTHLFGQGAQPGEFWYRFVEVGPLTVAALIGLYALYRVSTQMSGSLGRATSVMGIGYLIFAVFSMPHAVWHAEGTNPGYFGAGLSIGGLDVLFHVGSGLLFFFIAYGCYLAYKGQQTASGVEA